MMYKKEVPKLNNENFPTWKILMRLHIDGISNVALEFMYNSYVTITTIPLTAQQLKEKQEYN